MSAYPGQLALAVESIAAVSEQQSAATEEVMPSAEEMRAQVEELSVQARASRQPPVRSSCESGAL
ncbi:MAG: hypothetical protein E6I75_24800 [Chloroflexi bacterium]|nr:MAG: hypothetical protein E6I75_24800 [Chloroflexota bacterium]